VEGEGEGVGEGWKGGGRGRGRRRELERGGMRENGVGGRTRRLKGGGRLQQSMKSHGAVVCAITAVATG